jgi:hypothetical protein
MDAYTTPHPTIEHEIHILPVLVAINTPFEQALCCASFGRVMNSNTHG